MTPIGQLRVYGYMGQMPEEREIPDFVAAVLRDPDSGCVYPPPYEINDDGLVECADPITTEHFLALVDRGDAVCMAGPAAQPRHCMFFPAGTGVAEYLPLKVVLQHLTSFADDRAKCGDVAFRAGDHARALSHYELAAATLQTPELYARMLLTPMPPRRRERIFDALRQVATRPPTEHIEAIRAEITATQDRSETKVRP